jgi:hypothetical protein
VEFSADFGDDQHETGGVTWGACLGAPSVDELLQHLGR